MYIKMLLHEWWAIKIIHKSLNLINWMLSAFLLSDWREALTILIKNPFMLQYFGNNWLQNTFDYLCMIRRARILLLKDVYLHSHQFINKQFYATSHTWKIGQNEIFQQEKSLSEQFRKNPKECFVIFLVPSYFWMCNVKKHCICMPHVQSHV